MANCPNCGCHLRIIDWKQKCPKCGANIVLYDLQERLMKDADKAEVQHYYFQKKLDRLKASFAGSKLAIIRIITSILPIGAIFLPLFSGTAVKPLGESTGKVSMIQLYKLIGNIDVNAVRHLASGGSSPVSMTLIEVSLLAFLLSLVFMLLHFLLLFLSCSPKGKIRNLLLDTLMLAMTIISVIAFLAIPKNAWFSGSLGLGAWLYLALITADVAVDVATFLKGIEIHHAPCFVGGIPIEEYFKMLDDKVPQDEIRAEMYRRLTIQQQEKAAELKKEQAEHDAKEAAEKEKKEAGSKK